MPRARAIQTPGEMPKANEGAELGDVDTGGGDKVPAGDDSEVAALHARMAALEAENSALKQSKTDKPAPSKAAPAVAGKPTPTLTEKGWIVPEPPAKV
jgi:hypothetical protein